MPAYRVRPGSQEEKVGRLIIAAVLLLFLPAVPLGGLLIYPFTILTTWFHEMGHGIAALLTGQGFERLVIYSDGSGYAESARFSDSGALTGAIIAAGGPLGPVLAGSLLILASARREYWRPALLVLASAIGISVLVWVRSLTGWIVLPLLAAALAWIALRGPEWLRQFGLQFLGVLGAMSMFRDWDYLFSENAFVGGNLMPSDTGAIEQALFLPHWIWAALIIGLSAIMVGASLKYALARDG